MIGVATASGPSGVDQCPDATKRWRRHGAPCNQVGDSLVDRFRPLHMPDEKYGFYTPRQILLSGASAENFCYAVGWARVGNSRLGRSRKLQ
jgi:hypothetical protein